MKTKQWFGIIFATLVILSGCTPNNRGVVEHPAFIARSTSNLEVDKVVLSDTATILYIKAFFSPGSSIKPDPNTFLTDNLGKKYPILSTEGISMDEYFIIPDSGKTEFSLIFPPIAPNAVYIDYSEGDYNGAWNIWGIQLTNQKIKVNLPKDFKDVAIDKNAVLPPVEFKAGKAHLEGQILNYRSGMPAEVSVRVTYPFDSPEIIFSVDSTGKFSGEIDAFSAHPVSVYWAESVNQCFIAPGETTSLILNPVELSRRTSRLLGNTPSLGEPAYFGGYLAAISKELSQINSAQFGRRNFDSYESYIAFIKSIGTKTPEELRTSFMDEYHIKKAILDTLSASSACKQILNCILDLSYTADITDICTVLDRAYIFNNQLQYDRVAIDKYIATRNYNIPDDFYNVIKDFSLINVSQMLYVWEAAQYANQWQMHNMQPVLSKALGTDKGTLFDMMKISGAYNSINEFKPINDAQIEELSTVYREFIKNKNNELLQLIEANKNKTGYTIHDIAKVANKDVFPSILSKFKGKSMLIDFWATWCGPCKTANKELKPVKEEFANKDIVYVFVAGDNSPLETWENMIPDLHGEHFRLTGEQWDYVSKTFGIDGVPTYFFIDREGNIKEKQVGYYGADKMKEKLVKLLK